MAWAQEMKNLAADIKTSHKDRADRIGEIKRETRDILGAADDYMKQVVAELKKTAKDLKDFLAKSEDTRKKDFDGMMKGIQAKIKEIQGDVKDFLAESEEKRMADFKDIMKDIKGDINTIKKSVADTLKSTKGLIGTYSAERKEAAGYWTRSKGKEAVAVEKAAAKKQKNRQNEEEE